MDAIVIRNITKQFRKSTISREYTTLKSELVNLVLGRRKKDRSHYIEVLKGIDFTIPQGKTVGIIGRNGSGKSTLLKLINGVYSPTSGSIEVNGRISALLELGAGFHPDFSGRENILINGIILGMSRSEIRARMPEIIEFSELGDFIDEPVRTYSSGMYMRLAFAVATHVDPDILVVDEILAVGDEHFSRKSMGKMNEFKERGKTIVLVTHDLGTVERWCDQAVWIDKGVIRHIGPAVDVVQHYRNVVNEEEAAAADSPKASLASLAPQPRQGPPPTAGQRWGNFAVEIADIRSRFTPDQGLSLSFGFLRTRDVGRVRFHAAVRSANGIQLWRTELAGDALPSPLPESGELVLSVPSLPLAPGEYKLEVGVRSADDLVYDCHRDFHGFVIAGTPNGATGPLQVGHRWDASAVAPPEDGTMPQRVLATAR
ncbi:MAG: ABC transporter ATP-binding protein [Myxococcaceae bacterium]